MIRTTLAAAVAWGFLIGGASAQTPPPSAQRVEIPIRAVNVARGAPRYSIPVSVGGVTLDAMLDTGSSGLRVLSRALPASAYQVTSERSAFGFGSGAELRGFIANAPLAVGGVSGAAPFELVQSVGCTQRAPNCPQARIPFARYGIGGNGVPDAGFPAIIGIGMRHGEDGARNPLPLIGAARWIVELPRPGETAGKLILNPTDDELAGFRRFQLPRQPVGDGWADNALPACLTNDDTHAHICLPSILDSGAPGVHIRSNNAHTADWPGRSHATLVFAHRSGDLSLPFVIDSGLGTHVEPLAPAPRQPDLLMVGTLPYFAFDVFYDAEHGIMGLKPRA